MMKLNVKLTILLVVFCVLKAIANEGILSVNLSTEALSSGRYLKAIEVSKKFLDDNINQNTCTSEIMASLLYNLKVAFWEINHEDEYYQYTNELFNKIDNSRRGTLVRAFIRFALDCKGDYSINSARRHSFTDKGDNSKGIEFYQNYICKIGIETFQEHDFLEAWIHIVKADLEAYGENFLEAENEIKIAKNIIEVKFPKEARERIVPVMAMEMVSAMKGDWEMAAECASEVISEIEKEGKNFKEWYAAKAHLLEYYNNLGLFDKVFELIEIALVRESVFENAPFYIDYRSIEGPFQNNSPSVVFAGRDINQINITSASALFSAGKIREGAHIAGKTLYLLKKNIGENYSKFAFNKASSTLKLKVNLLVEKAPIFSTMFPQDSLIQCLAYDAALLYKQLPISAGTMYRNLAARLGNKTLLDRFKELEATRKYLDDITSENIPEVLNRISLLENNLEHNLSVRAGNISGAIPDWYDVRNSLLPQEAAIEFSIVANSSCEKYIASVLKYNSDFPEIIVIGDVKNINDIVNPLESKEAYKILWEPILEKLPGVTTLYFSPVGQLNLIPIEYFRIDSNQNLNNKYDIYRLSSTRELAFRGKPMSIETIALYGGIEYKLDEERFTLKQEELKERSEKYYDGLSSEEALELRAGFSFLPGTLEEIHNIEKIFTSSTTTVEMIEGPCATEASIKALSGKELSILHIATHGFIIPEKSRNRLSRILAQNDDRSTFEEQLLGRSGLLMAGATNTIDASRGSINSFDDGILTSREISRLDFSGLNTVVLSACESGLGDIEAEGVIGLQRGLKRAGVHTLVLSLWKVSDDATSILMTEFYTQLHMQKTPIEAMKNAQNFLRNYDNGKYSDNQYWGAFIIIDAI